MTLLFVIAIFFVVFPLFWLAIIVLISRLGGWASLASHYGYNGDPKPNPRKGRSLSLVQLRFFPCNYSFIVNLNADDQALYISVMKIFGAGHTPLRIPFRDLAISELSAGVMKMGSLRAAKANNIKISMLATDIEWIESVAGGIKPRT